jgi:hypothetical protein
MATLVPHEFRGVEVTGAMPVPNVAGTPEELRARMTGELERTMGVLMTAQDIERIIAAQKELDPRTFDSARALIWPWGHDRSISRF